MLTTVKKKLLGMFWPRGSKANIIRGPLKGHKFVISDNSGWSPIVGRWEPESQTLFTRVIKPGSVVYDLGANNGIHSLLFSKLVGAKGKVFSFEPLPSNCKEIMNNAALNNIDNIEVVQAAVSNQAGETVFHLGLHDKQGSLVGIGRESGNDIKVKLTTLDDFIDGGNPKPDFLKIDIEGAESLALHGFEKRVGEILPNFFIELHTPEQDEKVGQFLLKHNYKAFRLKDGVSAPELGLHDLEPIKDLTKPYPTPDGIWGTILAVHPSKFKSLAQ
ncbi:MAG: FkbM family methyltransferase [Chitinophagaceae bacterium]|nr:FkbM family methyltransferase [Chitinophagaceae bacterium]